MEPTRSPPAYTMEPCDAGGWKARFNPEEFEQVADRIRGNETLDVDTEHMLLWHRDDIKVSYVKSSGVMMIRTDDEPTAEELVEHALTG